jgi:hypothetical protein
MHPEPLYDTDFYAWTQQQAALLRAEKWEDVDYSNLAEEIESVGKREQHELAHRLMRLLQHLLKGQYQSTRRGRSWRSTIVEQRQRIARRLRESPSLRPALPAMLAEEYRLARLKASDEIRLPDALFPQTCPWTVEQILEDTFWPDVREETSEEGQA